MTKLEKSAREVIRQHSMECLSDKTVDAMREALAEKAEQEPEYKGWYCAHCERGVDGSEVTFHEQHEVCGRVITDDVPPKPVKQEPVAWAHWKSPDYAEDPAFLVTVTEKPIGWQTQSANWFPLYAAPQPVRTKDLTDDEIMNLVRDECVDMRWPSTPLFIARAVIAAYKEKNK